MTADYDESERMQKSPDHSIALDDDGHLACDLACVACAYNLRGLTTDGRCPECSAPVRRTLLGNILEHASSAWLRSLHRGASIISWALPATLLATIGLAGVGTTSVSLPTARPLLGIAVAVLCIIDLYALFVLTRRESLHVSVRERTIWRLFLRIWAIAAVTFGAAAITAWGLVGLPAWLVLHYAREALLVMFYLGMFGLTRHLVTIFDRAREFHVTTSVRSVGDPIAFALMTALVIFLIQSIRPRIGWKSSELTESLNSVGALLALAGLVGVCILVFKARGLLAELVDASEAASDQDEGALRTRA